MKKETYHKDGMVQTGRHGSEGPLHPWLKPGQESERGGGGRGQEAEASGEGGAKPGWIASDLARGQPCPQGNCPLCLTGDGQGGLHHHRGGVVYKGHCQLCEKEMKEARY